MELIIENTRNGEEMAGLQAQLRRAGAAEMRLRRELAQQREDDPAAENVRDLLAFWQRQLKPKAMIDPKTPRGGKRWKVAQDALKLTDGDVQMCRDAISWLALVPYVTAQGRRGSGKASQRYDDIEYALKDEARIEEFARKWRLLQASPVGRRVVAWQEVNQTAQHYFNLMMDDVTVRRVEESEPVRERAA